MQQRNRDDLKIILFMCSWNPHAAYQTLQDNRAEIPSQIKMVRSPCSGRISKALLFKPFEMGADGVALVSCEKGACRYGTGTVTAENNVADTREILDLLGLGRDRLRLAGFMGEDHDGLLAFLKDFSETIRKIGKSPVVPAGQPEPVADPVEKIRQAITTHDVYACQDCGKCTSACSLTLSGKAFSPRVIANALIAGNITDESVTTGVWSCLTCGLCYDRCPSAVNFPEFIRDVRQVLRRDDPTEIEAHGGFFGSLARTMTAPDLPVNHWAWLPDDITLDRDSDILFFGGCAPYFDVFFKRHLGTDTRKILVDSLRLMNFFDIHPALMADERCCGHDLLWTGDRDNFLKLARLNVDAIHRTGAREVVVACPEGFRTLARDYPALGIEIHFKVTHILELLEREIAKGAVGFKPLDRAITFQDPCRLARHPDTADLPRKLIRRLNPTAFTEMVDHGASAICCGNCAWTGCDAYSRALQVKRIDQARETGAQTLVTACPKCQVHLRCAMRDPFPEADLSLETVDLISLLAQTIVWK